MSNWDKLVILTARQQCCGKEMFSQASVSPQEMGGGYSPPSRMGTRTPWDGYPPIHGPKILGDTVDKGAVRTYWNAF